MKKSLLIVGLVVAFTLALAGVAYATWGDATYIAWSTSGVNSGLNSPHAGYQTTTRECAVCHAVHNAKYGSEALLPDNIQNACNYCHVSATCAYTRVYDGVISNYTVDTSRNHSNLCSTCHSVHGASTVVTLDGVGNSPFILKTANAGFGTSPTPGSNGATGAPAGWTVPVVTTEPLWCAYLCHHYGAEGGAGANDYSYYNQGINGRSHIMTNTLSASYKTRNGSTGYSGQVAWITTDKCQNCHASTTVSGVAKSGNFPHYTDGVRFLTTRQSTGATSGAAVNENQDGVCTRCHRSGDGSTGVGISF